MVKKVVKATGTLKQKKTIADNIELIVLEFKEEFKNLSVESLKSDLTTVEMLIKAIDEKFKNHSNIDKNDILLQVIKSIFPDLTEQELNEVQKAINYIVSKKRNVIVKFFLKILKMIF